LLLRTLGFPDIRTCETTYEFGYMYIGRRSRYNEVVPICARETDRLSGGIAPLILKLGSVRMCVVILSFLIYMFWRKGSSLAPSKI
jgi:hypothetical protein